MLDPASYRIEIGLVFLLLLLVELYLVGGVYERRRLGISTPIGRQVAYWADHRSV